MDERSELRVAANQPVAVTILGEIPEEIGARVVNYSRSGMRLALDRPVGVGIPLKIVWENRLVLGEVCYCLADKQGYSAGVALMHALHDTEALASLARRLRGDRSEKPSPVIRQEAN